MMGERAGQRRLGAHERDGDIQLTGGLDGTVDDRTRRVVTTHGVDGYAHTRTMLVTPDVRLFLVDGANLPLTVGAAMRTDAVGRLRLVALRAQPRAGRGQGIVRPALGRARLGMSSFRIRHCSGFS